MRVAIERKTLDLHSKKKVLDRLNEIKDGAESLEAQLDYDHRVYAARELLALARIQGLIRGFLGRIYAEEVRVRRKATITLQSVFRGRIGRKRWMYEYWKKISVVKSKDALDELIKRSTKTREAVIRKVQIWQEYFDPMTNSFWYFDPKSRLNTWTCPLVFQRELVCTWEGYKKFGGLPSQERCRCVFDTTIAYQNHMRHAHRWYCNACDAVNSGIVFPTCSTCGNQLSEDGEDASVALHDNILKVQYKLYEFMLKDKAEMKTGYKLKNRLIDKAVDSRVKKRIDDVVAFTVAEEILTDSTSVESNVMTFSSMLTDNERRDYMIQNENERGNVSNEGIILNKMKLDENSSLEKGPILPLQSFASSSALLPKNSMTTKQNTKADTVQSSLGTSGKVNKPLSKQKKNLASSIDLAIATFRMSSLYDDIDQDIKEGIIPPNEFDTVLDDVINEGKDRSLVDCKSSTGSESEQSEDDQTIYDLNGAGGKGSKMQICHKYERGKCKRTNCPLAHPGVRDKAVINLMRIPGQSHKVPYVIVCEGFLYSVCENGNTCDCYHVYIRPSTEQIIKTLYVKRSGERLRRFKSGAVLTGEVHEDMFNGHAVMTWPSGSTYIGTWRDNVRQGMGMFRTMEGIEYHGEWAEGIKHGFGVLLHPNGEEYIGEFSEGKLEGVGRLSSASGDVYEGQFKNGKFDGIGVFTTKTGMKYMGYMQEGVASGLGIQVLLNGEKYKGYFDRNQRHGKGVCSYKNGSRYAGEWYRGIHEGFGIYVTAKGERYVGQWRSSRKEGVGRYYFENGDFYDGEFKQDKAKGKGAYYAMNGNTYIGEWDNDKRNGRGTYTFANGSKYTGNFVDNDIHGKGKFDFANGSYYRGEFDKNRKHGRGIFTWSSMNIYKGDFYHDELKGKGEMQYAKGHRYIGCWDDNKKNGHGIFHYADGHIYVGMWKDDLRHGKGKMTYNSGAIMEESYDGDWIEDKKHGKGKYCFRVDEGTTYEGDWEWNIRNGFGCIKYRDGSFYRGDFKQEQMWGTGVYIHFDGSQYEGDWVNNMRHGVGTLMSTEGTIYQGEFWSNIKQGKGMEIRPDGSRYEGIWDCGIIVGEGRRTLIVGQGNSGGPTEITVKCFSY